ncbi:hypothetical protein AAVH_25206 [Aphelenchoides avenae]|nr:hypothetical protein AAVH_25206 [Aphelenchus avenae]
MLSLVSVHHGVDAITHALALLLTIVLLAVVHTTSTPSLTPYKCIFTFTCINDMLLAAVVLVTQPAIFCDMRMICFINNGFIAHSAPSIIFVCQATFCGLCITTFAFLSVPFLYRYHNLCRQFASIPSILACIDITSLCRAFMSEVYSKREQLNVVIAASWETEDTEENAQRIVCAAAGDPYLTLHGIINTATATLGFLCIGWSEYKIVRHVQLYKPIMTPSAQQRQRELHYALIAMVVCPLQGCGL